MNSITALSTGNVHRSTLISAMTERMYEYPGKYKMEFKKTYAKKI